MPRPRKWNGDTESVRLPKHTIEACLKLAAALDSPPPQVESNSVEAKQFQDYLRFVQNCGNPTMVTIADGLDEQQYLIQPEPCSFEDYQTIERAIDTLKTRMDAEKLKKSDRLLLFSKLVERVCKPIKGGEN